MMSNASRYTAATSIAVLMAFSGGAVAMGASNGTTVVKACSAPRTGVLSLANAKGKCPKMYRLVTWSQRGPSGTTGAPGAQGATGATGAQGAAGATGATGSVDTSQFYDKASSDARFLPLHGQADSSFDSQRLGGAAAESFVSTEDAYSDQPGTTSVSTYAEDVAGGDTDIVYPAQQVSVGTLSATCNDPASSTTLHYAFATGSTGSVQIEQGTFEHYYATPPVTDVVINGTGHASYVVDYANGSISWIEAYATAAPSGHNVCRVRVFYQRFIPY